MEFHALQPVTEGPSPTQLQIAPKSAPFTNGVLKRHAPPQMRLRPPVAVTYGECLKNHAASLGGHAVDGCCEFMLSPAYDPAVPTSLRCAACGCHRNFHRREPNDNATRHGLILLPAPPPPQTLEYRPHHRHHPPPPPGGLDDSPSPPPISSAYINSGHAPPPGSAGRKRFRPMQRKDDELIGVDKFGITVSTPPSVDAGAKILGAGSS